MRALPRVADRPPQRSALWIAASVVVVASLTAALATWQGSPVVATAPLAGCVLVITVFVLIRRSLRRASTLIDTILREEIGTKTTDFTDCDRPLESPLARPVTDDSGRVAPM